MSTPETPSNLTGTVVRGVGLAGLGRVLGRAITFGAYIVLARLVTPEELGIYAAGSIIIGLGLLLSQSGMLAAVIQRKDQLDEAASTAVVATVAAGLLFSGLALALAPLIGSFFRDDTVGSVAAAMAGVLFLQASRVVPNALLQRRFSLLRRAVVEPLAALAFGIGAIIATSRGMGVWGLVVGSYASAVTDMVASWALVRWRPRARLVSFAMWRELVAYGRHVLAGTVLLRIAEQMPVAVIGRFVGAGALGQFQFANRIVSTPYAVMLSGVAYVVFPAFARIADDTARFHSAFLRSLRWMMVFSAPLGLIMIPLGEPLAVVVLGSRWEQAGEALIALSLLVPGRAVWAVAGEAFKGAGIPGERTRVNLVWLICSTVAMVALLPFDLIGVAAGISIGAVSSAAYSLKRAQIRLEIPIGEMVGRIWAPIAAASAMALVLLPLELLVLDAASHGTAIGLGILALELSLGALLFLGALRALSPGMMAELRTLLKKARRGSGPARG